MFNVLPRMWHDLRSFPLQGLELVTAINTHVHADHVTGDTALKRKFPALRSGVGVCISVARADQRRDLVPLLLSQLLSPRHGPTFFSPKETRSTLDRGMSVSSPPLGTQMDVCRSFLTIPAQCSRGTPCSSEAAAVSRAHARWPWVSTTLSPSLLYRHGLSAGQLGAPL